MEGISMSKEESSGPGWHVTSFDSLDEMLAEQARREAAANEAILPKQRELEWGGYFCQPIAEMGLIVFGRVLSHEEIVEGEGPDEVASLEDAYRRGYRFSFCSSVIEPGEYGSKHISAVWPITEDDYNKAKDRGWEPWSGLTERIAREILEARQQ